MERFTHHDVSSSSCAKPEQQHPYLTAQHPFALWVVGCLMPWSESRVAIDTSGNLQEMRPGFSRIGLHTVL